MSGDRLLGIEIGGTKLQLLVAGVDLDPVTRRQFQVNPDSGGQGIREQLEPEVEALVRAYSPAAIGVGFGGPIDASEGRVLLSHQIEGWTDFPLVEWLYRCAGLPVYLENDANTAALGEALHGAGAGHEPVFYVTLGSGVGGGLVTQGQIYHGALPGEAEIGHIQLERQSRRAGTTVESRCSGWAVDRKIRARKDAYPSSDLTERVNREPPGGEARFLKEAVDRGDPFAKEVLEETGEELAFALSHVAHLCHPEIIVVGGGLSMVGEVLQVTVERHLQRFLMEAFLPGPKIQLAQLRDLAVPIGAILVARQRGGDLPAKGADYAK